MPTVVAPKRFLMMLFLLIPFSAMTRDEAISRIEESCRIIALEMMKVTPAARQLEDEETTADVVKAAYQLTVELEVIKKKLIKLKGRDDSSLL